MLLAVACSCRTDATQEVNALLSRQNADIQRTDTFKVKVI
jgi:hypothetical protein